MLPLRGHTFGCCLVTVDFEDISLWFMVGLWFIIEKPSSTKTFDYYSRVLLARRRLRYSHIFHKMYDFLQFEDHANKAAFQY